MAGGKPTAVQHEARRQSVSLPSKTPAVAGSPVRHRTPAMQENVLNVGTRRTMTYPIAEAIVKIGKYIAMTMNPIIVPRTTIMMGSSSDVMAATA